MMMFVASLALVVTAARTSSQGDAVCLADEPAGLFLLQSGPGLRTQAAEDALLDNLQPRQHSRSMLSLLQTSEAPEAEPHESVESQEQNNIDLGTQQVPAAPVGGPPAVDMRGHGAVTIVMPEKKSRAGIALATSKQNGTLREDENYNRGHGDTDGEQQDGSEDHEDSKNTDGKSAESHEDHEDTSEAASDAPDQVSDAEHANKKHAPEIFEIPSDECEKPCANGICHDGECFCRYPYIGLQCDIVAIAEIGKVLALTMLTCVALCTALCVLVVFRANQKTSAAVPTQEPHMADEEWLPPTDSG